MTDYIRSYNESTSINDSFSKISSFIKNLAECGLSPDNSLYPSNTLIPLPPINFVDNSIISIDKSFSEAFSSDDSIKFSIIKNLLSDILITDIIINKFVKHLAETGLMPSLGLLPSNTLYPRGGMSIYDTNKSLFSSLLADSFTLQDLIDKFNIGRNIDENVNINDIGINKPKKPFDENIVADDISKLISGKFLSESFNFQDNETKAFVSKKNDNVDIIDNNISESGKLLNDTVDIFSDVSLSSCKFLLDAFNFQDSDIKLSIGKNVYESINIMDNIIFSMKLYLSENPHILDNLVKHVHKPLNDSFDITDDIVKFIKANLPDSVEIDDQLIHDIRKMVRATLEILKIKKSSLETLKIEKALLEIV